MNIYKVHLQTGFFFIACIRSENPFTYQIDHKLEPIYCRKYIVLSKTKDIESFTNQINTRISSIAVKKIQPNFIHF